MAFAIAKTVGDDVDIEDEDTDDEPCPGMDSIREGLAAAEKGHAVKAIDMIWEGLNAFAYAHDKPIPWMQ